MIKINNIELCQNQGVSISRYSCLCGFESSSKRGTPTILAIIHLERSELTDVIL